MISKIRKHIAKFKTLSVLIELVGVVTTWRGIWGLLDLYLLPTNPGLSYILSIILGLTLIIIYRPGLKDIK